jgi:myosin heavy subunit
MLDLEYFSTKNNVILLADNDVVLNIKNCVIIPIDKLTLHLNYSLDETHSLNMSTETKTNFFEFLNSYNMGQCQHVLQLSNTEEIVQNNTKLQLDLEMQLASAKLDNLSMNSELEELRLQLKSEMVLKTQLETELRTQFETLSEAKFKLETELKMQIETLSEAKFKLETELLSMSRSNLSLERQLFEAIESKVKLETELESLKITKSKQPSMINNPKNLHLNSAKKPLVTSTNVTKSKINPAMTQIINSSKVSTSQKQTPKTKPRCTF